MWDNAAFFLLWKYSLQEATKMGRAHYGLVQRWSLRPEQKSREIKWVQLPPTLRLELDAELEILKTDKADKLYIKAEKSPNLSQKWLGKNRRAFP